MTDQFGTRLFIATLMVNMRLRNHRKKVASANNKCFETEKPKSPAILHRNLVGLFVYSYFPVLIKNQMPSETSQKL